MEEKIRKVLDRFEKTGPGSKVPLDDLDLVQEYVIKILANGAGDVQLSEAVDLTRFLQWGHWAEGWEKGYASGTRSATPHFGLNTNGHVSA